MTERNRRELLRRASGAAVPVGASGADRRPVVLVHGFADTGETAWWRRLRDHLRGDGYEEADLHTVSFGDRVGEASDSPRTYGADVAATVESVHDERGCPVDVVAHSMGGLGTRWALEELGAAPYVRELVTLGTPHQGTRAAHLATRTPGGRDMVPGSEFLGTLNDGATAEGVRYTAVWGSLDPLVVGPRRAELPDDVRRGADENRPARRRTHLQLVFDEDAYRTYRDRLLGTAVSTA
ncbi:esterase/lipase family protein [Natronomonas marina]|uniref:esterase/lipase family protein n=1 Tax=Natronomonas marina TaxID=2961939 RepID=UPI0020C99A7B|nr:alpha/beta fold hydrolase [Natronomonas marina]